MTLKAANLSNIKRPVLLLVVLVGLLLNACKKQQNELPVNVGTIRFSASAYTLERNAAQPLTVTLPLSLPLEQDATATVMIDNSGTAVSSQYTLAPAIPAGGLTINLAKGATEAVFTVTSLENFEGDITIVFKITSATGGLTISNTNAGTTVTIKGKPIILPAITTSVNSLDDFKNVNSGTVSASKSFTVTGVKLTAPVTVTAPASYKVSLDDVTFTNSVSITAAAAMAAPVTVYARFAPATGVNQTIAGSISLASGVLSGSVAVTGNESGNAAPGILIMSEDFNYGSTAGNLKDVNGGNWSVFSGSVNPIKYVVPGLTFAGYAGSGVGGGVISENGSGSREDQFRTFATQTSGTIYVAQLVNIATAAGGDFFTSLRDPAGGYFNRLYVKDDGGKPAIGLGKSTATTAYSPQALSYGTTYLVITKYDFASGLSSLYVLSGAIPVLEPANADATTDTGTGPVSLVNVIIRQNTVALTTSFDGIRVATSWKQAVGL